MVSLGKWSTNDGFPHRTVSLQDGKCNYNAHFREAFVMVSLHLTMQKNMTSNLTLGRRRGEKGGRGVARRGLSGNTICNIYIYVHILSIYVHILSIYVHILSIYIYIVLYTDHYWYISYNHSKQRGWRPFPAVTMAAMIVFHQSALQHALLLIPRRLEPWMNGHMGFS